jgi:hypothetical protein
MAVYIISGDFFSDYYVTGRNLVRFQNVLYTVFSANDGSTTDIFCASSTDTGKTWDVNKVTLAEAGRFNVAPSVVIDANGMMYLVWQGTGYGTRVSQNQILYSSRQLPDGDWSDIVAITDSLGDQYFPIIALDKDNSVYVVWYGTYWLADNKLCYMCRKKTWSTDPASGWGCYELIKKTNETWLYDYRSQMSLAVDSQNTLHVVVPLPPNRDYLIHYERSPD